MELKHKANCQMLIAICFFAHHGPRTKELFLPKWNLRRLTLQVLRGRGNWDPYGRPQTTGLQAVFGFPRPASFYCWLLTPPAPLP
jgi:hypothetical protein